MTMMDEPELHRRFARLRAADEEGTPQFWQTFERARRSRPSHVTLRLRPLMFGAATVIVLAVGWSTWVRWWSPSPVTPSIATWRAPTDVLLRTSASALVGVMPVLDSSILDKIVPIPSKKGA